MTIIVTCSICQLGAQNVGIGTSNPRSKLEVNGTLRVDTIKLSLLSKKILVQDSATGNVGYIPLDSVKSTSSSSTSSNTLFYAENDTQTYTASDTPVTRISLILQPGTYLISAYCEIYNTSYLYGASAKLQGGGVTIAETRPWSGNNDFTGCFTMKKITIVVTTRYDLQWYSDNSRTNSVIQRARISAIKF
jgi:hypothetical protein